MNRMLCSLGSVTMSLAVAASPAAAALQGATWVADSSTVATGSFNDGQTVTFLGYLNGIDEPAENGTSSPAIPGEASGGNPPGVAGLTVPPSSIRSSSSRAISSWRWT